MKNFSFPNNDTDPSKNKVLNSWVIFCGLNRETIKRDNPDIANSATEIMKKLSEIWNSLSSGEKKKYKDLAKQQISQSGESEQSTNVPISQNLPIVSEVVSEVYPSNSSESNSAEEDSSNHTIKQCGQCGKPFFRMKGLEDHMKKDHGGIQVDNVTNVEPEKEHDRETDDQEPMSNMEPEKDEATEDQEENCLIAEGNIVFVRHRVISWAAKITRIVDGEIMVKVYNKGGVEKKVKLDVIHEFHKQSEFRGNLPKGWKTGYIEALKEYENMKP